MPARKTWLLRVREIRQTLAAMDVPVIDRPIFERLFGVRRRRAIQLMHFFGGFQSGQTFLMDRLDLMRQLEPVEASTEFAAEERRRRRLIETLEELGRYRAAASVVIAVQPLNGRLTDLPEGIWLQPGSLKVDFRGAAIGQATAAAQDYINNLGVGNPLIINDIAAAIRNSNQKILDVGEPNRQIEEIYIWRSRADQSRYSRKPS